MTRPGIGEIKRFAKTYLSTMDPEQAAAAIGAKDGAALLAKREFAEQIDRQRRLLHGQLRPEDVVRYLGTLAFGRCNDCVKLALEDAPEVEKLDLRLLSEIKRNEKGTVEVKLLDRLEILEQLQRLMGANSAATDQLLAAMTAACEER